MEKRRRTARSKAENVAAAGCGLWLGALLLLSIVTFTGGTNGWWWLALVAGGIAIAVLGLASTKRAPSPPPAEAEHGRPAILTFAYTNAAGHSRTHEVSAWRINGDYLEGADTNTGEFKTYRLDRVQRWIGPNPLSPPLRAGRLP